MKHLAMSRIFAAAAVCLLTAAIVPAQTLETVATFDTAQGQLGENLVFDLSGHLYLTLVLSNAVVKISPPGAQSTYATFPAALELSQPAW